MKDKYVYFIKPVGMSGPIKIGCSDAPSARLAALATWSPFPLEIIATIPGGYALERNIQECFLDVHSHREWFHGAPRLQSAIAKLAAGVSVEDAIDLSDRKGSITSGRKRKPWAPETRASFALMMRVIAAEKRAARMSGERRLAHPDIHALMRQWRGVGDMPAGLRTLVDELVADPVAATLTIKQRWPEIHAPSTSASMRGE